MLLPASGPRHFRAGGHSALPFRTPFTVLRRVLLPASDLWRFQTRWPESAFAPACFRTPKSSSALAHEARPACRRDTVSRTTAPKSSSPRRSSRHSGSSAFAPHQACPEGPTRFGAPRPDHKPKPLRQPMVRSPERPCLLDPLRDRGLLSRSTSSPGTTCHALQAPEGTHASPALQQTRRSSARLTSKRATRTPVLVSFQSRGTIHLHNREPRHLPHRNAAYISILRQQKSFRFASPRPFRTPKGPS